MNFVGHAYIAKNNPELIAGNFAGDSYKGHLENFVHLPSHILNGIQLHRYIDDYTDNSPFIRSVGQRFQEAGITKVAYIASDILLDHYLTKNWNHYSDQSLPDFIHSIYEETDKNLMYLEEDFCFMYAKLKEFRWLFHYETEEGIDRVLWQFSRRIGFKNDLSRCMAIYQDQKIAMDKDFEAFMASIVDNSAPFIAQLIN